MKSSKFSIKIGILAGILSLFFYAQTRFDSHWSTSETSRSPSSLKIFDELDPLMYQDYFSNKYKIDLDFWTDKDEDSIRKRARLALHSAIRKTLLDKDNLGASKQVFKENLIQSFMDHFLKSLYLLKIVNGTFQIDLNFSPAQIKEFETLMRTNQLIDSSKKDNLLSTLTEESNDFTKNLISGSSSGEHKEEENFNMLGGTITLWVKILDLNWNPINPIPNPPKNAVKGFVKYRRYFKASTNWAPRIHIKDDSVKLDGLWKSEELGPFITVDLTKEFDLQSLIPSPSTLEIYFGKIRPQTHYKTGPFAKVDLLSRIFKDEQTNEFLLRGSLGHGKETQNFEFKVGKIEFDLQKNEFSQSSRIKAHGDWDGFNHVEKRKFKNSIRHSLLGDNSFEFIKGMGLDRFHKSLKEVKSK